MCISSCVISFHVYCISSYVIINIWVFLFFATADFGYGEWSPWSTCSSTCESGTHLRSRKCGMPDPGDTFCLGASNQTAVCDAGPCPGRNLERANTNTDVDTDTEDNN